MQLRDRRAGHRPLPRQSCFSRATRRHGAAPITTDIPTFDELGLPPVLKDVAMTKRGLVIFVGATGSGKSTSLAAMIDYRNENSTATSSRSRTRSSSCTSTRLHHHAARGRRRHRQLGDRAEEHAAPGARRDPDRRDPRPRDDGARDRVRRDRPPVPGHAARATAPTRRSTASSTSSRKSAAQQLLMDLSLNLKGVVAQRLIPRRTARAASRAIEIMLNSPLIVRPASSRARSTRSRTS